MPTTKPKKRPVTEEITLDRAVELLRLHKGKQVAAKSVIVSVVRDPRNTNHILSVSLNEAEVSLLDEHA